METGKWFLPHCWKTAPKPQVENEGCLDNGGELRLQGRGQGNTAAGEAPVLNTPDLTPGVLSFTGLLQIKPTCSAFTPADLGFPNPMAPVKYSPQLGALVISVSFALLPV